MDEKDKSRYLGDVEYFSAKLEQDPSSMLYVPLAKAYIKLEKYDEAVALLSEAIDNNSDVLSAKTMLARAYLGLGNRDEAKAVLTEVQVIDKNNYLASKLMGDILRSEENIKKALLSYRNALLVAPEDVELKNLVEELMSASGIAAHELDEEISLMDADDDMLNQLGSELAEEVRQQVGDAEFGSSEASEDEVGKTIDNIIEGKSMADDEDEKSLDNFEEDSGFGEDELEEELVASLEDSIIPTQLSSDDAEPSVKLDSEIMEADEDGDAPAEDDVRALAAELGADLGLEPETSPDGSDKKEEPDEVDKALDGILDEGRAEDDKAIDGMTFFEGADDEPEDIDEEKLLEEISEGDKEADSQGEIDEVAAAMAEVEAEHTEEADETEKVDEVAAAMAEVEAEQTEEADETEEVDEVAAAMAEVEAEHTEEADETEEVDEVAAAMAEVEAEHTEETDETEEVDEVAAAMAEVEAEHTEETDETEEVDEIAAAMAELEAEHTEDSEDVSQAQDFDELENMLSGAEAVDEDAKPDELTETEAAIEPEEVEEPAEETETEEVEEIFEASMDELLEEGPSEENENSETEHEDLTPETREQVNRLENLLEIIKNNSGN
ncbi:MAG: hypothetical protein C0602_05320 [Denitrovibrio sp.]|nr:MAG: hypothetical protein C0602_05320 [Denitrovibrio sp.]